MPSVDEHIVPLQTVRAALDEWIRGSGLLVIDAPSGFGKTAQVARWLSTRPDTESVIWVTAGTLLRDWEDALGAFARGMLDLGLVDERTHRSITGPADLYVALAQLKKVLILVFDGTDMLSPRADLNRLESEVSNFPLLRPIVITGRPLPGDPLAANPARRTLTRHDLALSASEARVMLRGSSAAAVTLRVTPEALVQATGGRASAIRQYSKTAQSGDPLPELKDFRRYWSSARVSNVGPVAADLFFVMAQFLQAPREYLVRFAGEEVDDLLSVLLREGLIEAVPHPGLHEPHAFTVTAETRADVADIAELALGKRRAGIHQAAAEHFLSRGAKAFAIYHFGQLRRFDEALRLVRGPLSGTDITSGLADLREALETIPLEVLAADPEALSIRVLIGRLPPREDTAILRELKSRLLNLPRRATEGMPLRQRMLVATAALDVANSRGVGGRVVESARELGSATLALPPEQVAELGHAPGLLWAAQAESELLHGNITSASEFARLAYDAAHSSGHGFAKFLAAAIRASLDAIEGDFASAREFTLAAELHYGLGNWPSSDNLNALAFANILTASADLDPIAMQAEATRLKRLNRFSSSWHALGVLAEGYAQLYSGNPERALARVRSTLRSPLPPSGALLLRSFIAAAGADLLSAVGRPAETLSYLRKAPETPEHSFCLGSRRASAHLMLGDAKAALKETEACLALGLRHTTRTLASVLLRRAVSHQLLGSISAADSDFQEALQHVAISRSRGVFHGIDIDALAPLWTRLANARPDLHHQTADLIERWRTQSLSLPRVAVSQPLTDRETAVLHYLSSDTTISQIGEALYISENTVKTHLRSIYQKLRVSTRHDAIQAAHTIGLLDSAHSG
ncbi:LuxR C-terminal-related transcriptional regulator [soil metagenome]